MTSEPIERIRKRVSIILLVMDAQAPETAGRLRRGITELILAEREDCAMIADEDGYERIAAEIRAQQEPEL